ncbi:unnamed protein product [Symbiodinium necroappetens]|uniref:Uncharacterized protein n=1 Tax=Symbiodinium necroappetens TaxID=1628268 RepID=A0A812WAK9_9DINO|nr:unnamed protein product [Symbiodinium necroappetens]
MKLSPGCQDAHVSSLYSYRNSAGCDLGMAGETQNDERSDDDEAADDTLRKRLSAAFEEVATPSPGRLTVTPPTRHPQCPSLTPSADKPRRPQAGPPSESEIFMKLQLQQMQEAMQAQSLLLAQLTQQSVAAAAGNASNTVPPATRAATNGTPAPEPSKPSPAKAPKAAAAPKRSPTKKASPEKDTANKQGKEANADDDSSAAIITPDGTPEDCKIHAKMKETSKIRRSDLDKQTRATEEAGESTGHLALKDFDAPLGLDMEGAAAAEQSASGDVAKVKSEINRYLTQVNGKIDSIVKMMGQLVPPYNPDPNEQTGMLHDELEAVRKELEVQHGKLACLLGSLGMEDVDDTGIQKAKLDFVALREAAAEAEASVTPQRAKAKARCCTLVAEPLKEIPEASVDYPMIRATDFIHLIDEQHFWTRLIGQSSFSVGCQMMADFWARYRIIFPDYELFTRADRNEVDLNRCLPCLIHGDEGTHYKRSGIMIVQWQSVFGKGTSLLGREAFADRLLGESNAKAFVNQRGVTFTTRFLLGVLPKDLPIEDYAQTPEVLDQFFAHIVEATAGKLQRTFRQGPKAASSSKPGKGLCHYCLAGREGYDWEDMIFSCTFMS